MKKSIKGALLSGLVFPGAGQVALKQYARGLSFIFIVLVSFAAIIVKGTQIALAVLQRIEIQGGGVDMDRISQAATRAVTASDSLIINGCLALIILCWIIAIVDAYSIGKKMDQQESKTGQN